MKILMILSYYYPYTSGLSEYVKRISEALVSNGHSVKVVTLLHDSKLPKKEIVNGVVVVRCPYIFRIGKGLASLSFILTAMAEAKKHEAVNIHLPLLEAGILLKLIPKATITYHCDLKLGKGLVDMLTEKLYYLSAGIAVKKSKTIITYTEDYARNSRLLRHHTEKCAYIAPVVDEHHFSRKNTKRFNKSHHINGKPVIGFAGRFVYEKGLPYLLKSIPYVLKKYPNAVFVFAGEYEKVAGGSTFHELRGLFSSFIK